MYVCTSGWLGSWNINTYIGDCHIYDRHIPLVEKLLEAKPIDVCPKLIIKNPTKDFYQFKLEDFEVQGYDYNKEVKIGKIPVAI